MVESALTIAAAILGIQAGLATIQGQVIVGSIFGLASGVIKLIRGMVMMHQAFQGDDAQSQAVPDLILVLRTAEGVVAGLAVLVSNPLAWAKIPAILFSFAKTLRGIQIMIAAEAKTEIARLRGLAGDHAEEIAAQTTRKEKAEKIAEIAHWFEVAMVGITGVIGLEGGLSAAPGTAAENLKSENMTKAGGMMLGIGASKAVRASGVLKKKPQDGRADPATVDLEAPAARDDQTAAGQDEITEADFVSAQ